MLRTKLHKIPARYHPDAKIFAWMALFIGLGNATFWTLFPLIISEKIGSEDLVGYYYAIIAGVGFLIALGSYKLFTRYSKVWITKITLAGSFGALVLMSFADLFINFVILDLIRAISVVIITISISLLVRDFSKKTELSMVEGRFYAFANIGWLAGPLIAGIVATKLNNESVFFAAGLSFLVALILFLREHLIIKNPHLHHRKHEESRREFLKNLYEYFKNPELRKVALTVTGLNLWWVIFGIYAPLQLDDLGKSEFVISLVMTLSALPYLIFDPWAGKWAKKNGVKKYIILGYLIMALGTLSFVPTSLKVLTLMILFGAVHIGGALVEPLKDVYFFEVVPKKDDERFFGIYNSGEWAAQIIGPFLSSVVLIFSPKINVVWIVTAIIMGLIGTSLLSIKKKY